jgi:hypothetical protein
MNMNPKTSGLSREFILRSILKLYDDACKDNQFGRMVFEVEIQRGQAQYISPYFKPIIKEES